VANKHGGYEILHALVLRRRVCGSFVFEQRLGQLLRGGEELLALRIHCSGYAPLRRRYVVGSGSDRDQRIVCQERAGYWLVVHSRT
jgi:hypothetical protein